MAYYGDPLGLNWFPMLALYSSLGKSSNSYEEKCQIGSQLQKLDGKDRLVIEGINSKIDQLIARNKVALSPTDMASLKSSIVSELGNIASRPGNQSSSPVVCDANSLVFDEDVKSLLSDLVREKSRVFNSQSSRGGTVFSESDSETIKRLISNEIYTLSMEPDFFKGNLYNRDIDDMIKLFEKGSSKLIIDSDTSFEEGVDNSMYAMEIPIITWRRSITTEKLLEASKSRFKNKKIPKKMKSTLELISNHVSKDREGNDIYTLNDVELLRVSISLISKGDNSI